MPDVGRVVTRLAEAMREPYVVSFVRPFEQGSFLGYVLDIGPKFFLIAVIDTDTIRFNGFSCLRWADVRRLETPHRYQEFVVKALRKRHEGIKKKPRVDLASTQSILRSADKIFPLITIHLEKLRPDVCYIGCIAGASDKSVSMLEIGPDAVWDQKPTERKLSEITRIDFGGQYEDALHLIGGNPRIKGSRNLSHRSKK